MRAMYIGALGVVFGDIGTSPLYAVQTIFSPGDPHPVAVSTDTLFGVLSMIFWSVTIIVSITYVTLVMRADDPSVATNNPFFQLGPEWAQFPMVILRIAARPHDRHGLEGRGMSNARLATADDVPQLSRAIARAFFDDPVAAWSCQSNSFRPHVLERFHGTRLRQLIARGEVWTTDELKSAALWAPPGLWNTTLREDIQLARSIYQPRVLVHPVVLARSPMVALALTGIERKHPTGPEHWYLAVVATDPESQGHGLGGVVLSPILDQCDRDGVGAYLESSKETNIAYYARLGFRVTEEHRLPRGPSVWAMWRDPA